MRAFVMLLASFLVLALADVSALPALRRLGAWSGCTTDLHCSFNGVCSAASCVCRPGWTGSDCGELDEEVHHEEEHAEVHHVAAPVSCSDGKDASDGLVMILAFAVAVLALLLVGLAVRTSVLEGRSAQTRRVLYKSVEKPKHIEEAKEIEAPKGAPPSADDGSEPTLRYIEEGDVEDSQEKDKTYRYM